jgi:Flp pilus assembly protein TadG
MTGRLKAAFRVIGVAQKAFRDRANWLTRGKSGIAAVEFALILPMLLALYFGCVVLAQGLEVGRKTQLLSRTLADLTSQQLPGQQTSGNCSTTINRSLPCLVDSDITNILSASSLVLYPFNGTTNITISEVIFDNLSSGSTQCCVARVVWSVASGPSPTLRVCGQLTQSANGVNGATFMPAGVYPPAVSSGNSTDYYLIVADVTYSYQPGFGFQNNAWNQSANSGAGYTIAQTTYMTPRNGSASPVVWANGGTIASNRYRDCTGGSYGLPTGATQPTGYNVP